MSKKVISNVNSAYFKNKQLIYTNLLIKLFLFKLPEIMLGPSDILNGALAN